MGGVINLIKKLFSGILSLIGLGGKSSGGYYMEAEPLSATEAPQETKQEPQKLAAPKAEVAKPEPAKAEKVSKPATADLNGSANGSKPPATANTLNLPQPTASFSTTAPTLTTPRRRPGANMGAFLDMAKTVKTPNS
jgi:hypothetical protein